MVSMNNNNGINNNAKNKKTKKGNSASMPLQYLSARLANPNFHEKENEKKILHHYFYISIINSKIIIIHL